MKKNALKLGSMLAFATILISCKSNAQSDSERKGGKERPSIEELFTKMDSNEDGKLAKDEVKGPMSKDFAKIDTDEDGFITMEELEKAPKPDRQGRPPQRN
ncbi:EF-hand domain-containing protein [Aquimarina pacifica]|uniref:EF-hand domain-containing protein n=1 Tax=Aquimarina pacifica TaxID=1296415 RepID=UPI00046FE7C1|nr:EF-hand domain-containing protein [Aquimarina pacifica]